MLSRSTWACELKWLVYSPLCWNEMSRSTWACELKCTTSLYTAWRVRVTLHVSVWVEIYCGGRGVATSSVTLHVSVWVEMLVVLCHWRTLRVTLHVSVWVEIVVIIALTKSINRHAPRERVSWNFHECGGDIQAVRHAPRERVSWNDHRLQQAHEIQVTLHVSVWVEIRVSENLTPHSASRSTWACELKYAWHTGYNQYIRHAPRERVSWNSRAVFHQLDNVSHAPRERVSWNYHM